jgi:hypothetical protein
MLEPYDGKLSRTVLRGLTLLDTKKKKTTKIDKNSMTYFNQDREEKSYRKFCYICILKISA